MKKLYTIGYEGTDIDRFVATLKAARVRVLADVRAVAVSRKKGFSKSALRERLLIEDIAYTHFVELGDPKPGREAARAGRHEEFFAIYTEHLRQVGPQNALTSLARIVYDAPTCLLCFERDPSTCHRTIVADRLKPSGIEVVDLYGDDPSRYVRHLKLSRADARKGTAQPQQNLW